MKKILSLTAILIFAFLVTACDGEEKIENRNAPSADVKVLGEAFLRGDEVSLKKIGLTKEEYEEQFVSEFAKNFTASSGLNFTPEQIQKVNDALRNLLSRSTCEVEDISTDGDSATVKVIVSTLKPFDQNTILTKLPKNIAILSETERNDAIATAFAELFNDWQYIGTTEFNAECNYNEDSKMWLPVDIKKFGTTISTKIFNM